MTLSDLIPLFLNHGCKTLYTKRLAENDNSKNQIYFGPGFDAVNLFPNLGISADTERKNFKAALNFFWLADSGQLHNAPRAQLILYPQYPEVRFSGFLVSCKGAPSELLNKRLLGRTLLLGVTNDGKTIGYVLQYDEVAPEKVEQLAKEAYGVFSVLDLLELSGSTDARGQLIAALRTIHEKAWIDSKQLDSHGQFKSCNAPQCGGFTLEAELGIAKNSLAEPDYLGYEIKQHSVSSFDRPGSGSAITLMTPEPKLGFYAERGAVEFIRRFGYADKLGREDRINFGGIHKVGQVHATTGLCLTLVGYNMKTGKIEDMQGSFALLNRDGEMAAGWSFLEMLKHWTKKHAKACYVPSMSRVKPVKQYSYGHKIRIAEQTDFQRLLTAFAKGDAYYDPGIKLEQASSSKPKDKRRSQFRIGSKNIPSLYHNVNVVDVTIT